MINIAILDIDIFSPSESEKLKNLLKNPEEDLHTILSILENKILEKSIYSQEIEEKYHSLLDGLTHAGIGIDIVSKDYKILFQNEILKERFGNSKDNICYKSYLGLENPCEVCPMEEALKYNRIERIKLDTADGKTYELISAPYPNQDGSIDKVAEVIIDITERKKMEEKLRESEEKYRNLFKYSPIGIFLFDEDGIFLEGNTSLSSSFSGNPSNFSYGKNFTEIIQLFNNSNELLEIFKKRAENRAKGMELEPIEIKLVRQDGEVKWVHWQSSTIKLKDKVIIQAIVQDITKRKYVEEKLKESENKYKKLSNELETIIDIIPGMLFIKDKNDIITHVNQNFADSLNLKKEQVIGKTSFDLFPLEQAENYRKDDIEVINSGKPKLNIEESADFPNGKIWAITNKTPYFDDNGDIVGIIGLAIDITERKKIEEILKETEIRFRSLIEQTTDAVFCYEFNPPIPTNLTLEMQVELMNNCTLVDCNLVCARSYGYDRVEDVIGRKLTDLFGTAYHSLDKLFRNIIEGGYRIVDSVGVEKLPNGEKRYYLNNGHCIIEDDKIQCVWGSFRDITDRMRAEQKLKESEEKFRLIAEQASMGIMIMQDGKIKYINQAVSNINGYSVEEILNWSEREILQTIYEEDSQRIKSNLKRSEERDLDRSSGSIFRLITKNGNLKWIEEFNKKIIYEGNPASLITLLDITNKIEAEEKLKESEEKFRNIAEHSLMGILIIQDGLFKYYNTRITEVNGYSVEEIKNWGPNEFTKTIYPEDREFVMEQARKKQIGDPDVFHQYRYRTLRKDGEIRWTEIYSRTITYEGRPADLAMIIDIDDKIKAEIKLKESEENFRIIAEQSLLGIIIIQNGRVVYVNNAESKIMGYTIEEMINWRQEDLFNHIHPDYRGYAFNRSRKNREESEQIPNFQYRIITKFNETRIVEIYSKIIDYNEQSAFLTFVLDVTDKNEAEQKLRESEEKFRKITEESDLAICIIQDDIIKYVNQEWANLYRYTIEDMLKWSPGELLKLVAPESLETVREQLRKKQMGDPDVIIHYPIKGIKSNGDLFWVDNISHTIIYEGRPADLVTQIDISDRIKAQQELVNLNQLKSELLRRTSHELKTPLVSIKGFTELLLNIHRDKLDAMVISTLNEIKQGCLRLETLIGDILKTAELESGATQLHKSEEDLAFLIKLCINEIKGFSKLRNHTIKAELNDKLMTNFEKEQIHQVISNLLNNAVKYTPPGGLIEIKSEVRDEFIIISIKDNGIGFTEEEKTRIFKQFGKIERYGQGLDIIAEGSGFGLFISKKIIELHDGKIWVESEGRTKGSTFYFSLPLIDNRKKGI